MSLCVSLLAVVLILNGVSAQIQMCMTDAECGPGRQCVDSHVHLGNSYCKQSGLQAKRTGSCPTVSSGRWFARQGVTCGDNTECQNGQRCCSDPMSGTAKCVQAVPCPNGVKLTGVRHGSQQMISGPPQMKIQFNGAIVLVQSGCKNVLVDSGGYTDKLMILSTLRDKLGLYTDDIDVVVTTHGHPDHYANINLFPRALAETFDSFDVIGPVYNGNPLGGGQQYFLMNDPNLELIQTPGHTLQDTSLVVRNDVRFGTITVAGDLFMDGEDYKSPVRAENMTAITMNRRKVACMSDYIVPGHGNVFQVTQAHRQALGPC